jgi:hypothetical protein
MILPSVRPWVRTAVEPVTVDFTAAAGIGAVPHRWAKAAWGSAACKIISVSCISERHHDTRHAIAQPARNST